MGIFFEVGLEYSVWERVDSGWEHRDTIIPLRLLDARLTKSSLLPEAQKRLEASYHQSKRPREHIGQEIPDIQLTDFECMRAQEALTKAQTQKPDAHFSVAFGWSHVTHCTY
jgi:hypothetical protein